MFVSELIAEKSVLYSEQYFSMFLLLRDTVGIVETISVQNAAIRNCLDQLWGQHVSYFIKVVTQESTQNWMKIIYQSWRNLWTCFQKMATVKNCPNNFVSRLVACIVSVWVCMRKMLMQEVRRELKMRQRMYFLRRTQSGLSDFKIMVILWHI